MNGASTPDDAPRVVIDTNVVLDVLVFEDPACQDLRDAVEQGRWRWLVCPAMRDELQRVLGYPQIAHRLAVRPRTPEEVLARFDALSHCVAPGLRAPVRCADPDDQIFVDLACTHRAGLLSKDRLVLRLRRRLDAHGVRVTAAWAALVSSTG